MKNQTATVLIVEDDRWLMSRAFDQVCPQIKQLSAYNGVEAVRCIRASTLPVFVPTDLNMPKGKPSTWRGSCEVLHLPFL